MRERLRSEGIVLAPGLLVVALFVYWAAHGGGYEPTTWEPSALVVLGLLVATLTGLGVGRIRLARPTAIALAALAGYVAWSYLSIAWAAAPGDALDGSNRALLYLVLFALFAVLPWRTWTATVVLSAFALGIGTIALVTLVRVGSASAVLTLFSGEGRLISPMGYENGTAALFMVGTLVSIGLATRRELPVLLRALFVALATAALQASILAESRGWLFALPVVLVLAIALMPARVRFVLWTLPPIAGGLIALHALLGVYDRANAASGTSAQARVLTNAAAHASSVALAVCAGVFLVALACAFADRRVAVPASVARGANRVAAGLAILVALAGVAAGLAATHGRPDHTIADYWNRSNGYKATATGSSRFALVGSNRPDFWRVALDAAAAHPLGGLGQDNWGDYYLRHRRADEQPRWTHSLELRLLAHTGIVGFLLFAAFLGAALVAALRGRARSGQLASAVAATAVLPLVVWVVHGSIDWFWEFPALSGPAFAFLALATALMRQGAPASAPTAAHVGRRRAAMAAFAVVALLAACAIALPYLAERDVAQATATWRTQPRDALARLAHAADLDPLASRPDVVAGVIALELGRPAQARTRLTAAVRRDPDNWFIAFARGLAASTLGNRAIARADYARADALNPHEPLATDALRRVDGAHPLTISEAFGSVLHDVQKLTGTAQRDRGS